LHLDRMHWGIETEDEKARRAGPDSYGDELRYLPRLAEHKEQLCSAITTKYSTLTDLSVTNAAWLNDADTAFMIGKLPNLQRLNLAGNFWAWGFGPGAHPAQATMVAISELTNLKALDLSANTPDMGVALCDERLSGLSKCQNLELVCFGARAPYQLNLDTPTRMFTKWHHVLNINQGDRTNLIHVRLVQHLGERRIENVQERARVSVARREVSLTAVRQLLRRLPNLVIRHGDGACAEWIDAQDVLEAHPEIRRIEPNGAEYWPYGFKV
jgi:hypothetical protein